MIKDLSFEQEKKLANSLYYGGGYTKKYENGGVTPLQSNTQIGDWAGQTGSYSDTQGNTFDMGDGGDGGGGKPDSAAIMGAGLAVGSAAIDALDDDPSYGNADIASSTLKYASMGAVAGPWGAAAGAAVGLGVGIVQKGKAQKAEKKAKHKELGAKSYQESMFALSEFEGYQEGGTIKNIYNHGGETHPPAEEVKDTSSSLMDYINSKQSEMSPEKLAAIQGGGGSGTITEDKGLWNEDKSAIWNTRNLLDVAVNKVQTASLRPGGGGGNKNLVTTGLSEMFALPSINRLIKPDGDLEHIAKDPTKLSNYGHAALNVVGAIPGASLVNKGLRVKVGEVIPALKGTVTKTIDAVTTHAEKYVGQGGVAAMEVAAPHIVRAEKAAHHGHQAAEINTAMAQGGMTPGAYSHSTNPLAVVDSKGNHTGMELTGGEGVFDKPAMDKIKKLLQGGRFDEVGSFVSNEMNTWKHK